MHYFLEGSLGVVFQSEFDLLDEAARGVGEGQGIDPYLPAGQGAGLLEGGQLLGTLDVEHRPAPGTIDEMIVLDYPPTTGFGDEVIQSSVRLVLAESLGGERVQQIAAWLSKVVYSSVQLCTLAVLPDEGELDVIGLRL